MFASSIIGLNYTCHDCGSSIKFLDIINKDEKSIISDNLTNITDTYILKTS